MKAAIVLLFVFCYVECRKTLPPIDKNANLAFINMEAGGMRPPPQGPPSSPPKAPVPPVNKPVATSNVKVVQPPVSIPTPGPAKPAPAPAKPSPAPAKPSPAHNPQQIKPVPVNPAPVANPITTPGPGSVKQLINFYDSQGKASPIRPYSYSQAVKQG